MLSFGQIYFRFELLGYIRCHVEFVSHFSKNFLKANRIVPDETPRSVFCHIWGYTVCLRPINRAPGLYELNTIAKSLRIL